jgi:hypothetical protein
MRGHLNIKCVETIAVFVIEYNWESCALICFAVYEYAPFAVKNDEYVLLSLCFLMLLLLHAFVCYVI